MTPLRGEPATAARALRGAARLATRAAAAGPPLAAAVLAPAALTPVALALAPRAAAAPAPGAAGTPPLTTTPGGLRDYACHAGRHPTGRSIFVAAEMHALSRPARLALRARLLRAPLAGAVGGWQVVPAGALGRWLHPQDPTLGERPRDTWIVRLPVEDLQAPARYRLQVAFRWSDSHGRVLTTLRRLTPVCRQPDPRPDLLVEPPVAVQPDAGDAAQASYSVRVGNTGRSAAGRFVVRFQQGGASQQQEVAGLAPRRTVTLRFHAAACAPGTPPQVIVDPDDRVQDADRANNVISVNCG